MNARYCFRLYEDLTFSQDRYETFDHSILYNPTPYIIPAGIHSRDDIDKFENKMKVILGKKFEEYNKKVKENNENYSKNIDINYTKNKLYKTERQIFKKKKKTVSKIAIHCLFYSISFTALSDTWKEIREKFSDLFDKYDDTALDLIKNDDEGLVKSISMLYHFGKYGFDKRNFFTATDIMDLIKDRKEYGKYAAASRHKFYLPFCNNCYNSKARLIPIKEKCSECGSNKKN